MIDKVVRPSEFAGRRDKRDGIPPVIQNQPKPSDPGGDQGSFTRPPCGECIHWKKTPGAGIGQGLCMMMPPNSLPIPGPDGRIIGTMNLRPSLKAGDEGCDQHETEEEGDEELPVHPPIDGEPPNLLKAVGG